MVCLLKFDGFLPQLPFLNGILAATIRFQSHVWSNPYPNMLKKTLPPSIPCNVLKTIINHPFGNGLYYLFMVKLGMVYNCFTNIKPYANDQGTVSGTVSDVVTASGVTSPGSMSAMSRMASSVAMGRTTVRKHQKWKELVEVLTGAEVLQQRKKMGEAKKLDILRSQCCCLKIVVWRCLAAEICRGMGSTGSSVVVGWIWQITSSQTK